MILLILTIQNAIRPLDSADFYPFHLLKRDDPLFAVVGQQIDQVVVEAIYITLGKNIYCFRKGGSVEVSYQKGRLRQNRQDKNVQDALRMYSCINLANQKIHYLELLFRVSIWFICDIV